MIESDLYSHLSSDVNLAALVGDRIYPLKAPENSQTPFLVYQNINYKDETSMQGEAYANKSLFQIDVYSTSYSSSKVILGAVRNAMYQFKKQPHYLSARDLYEKDTKLFRQLIEFNLIHKG